MLDLRHLGVNGAEPVCPEFGCHLTCETPRSSAALSRAHR